MKYFLSFSLVCREIFRNKFFFFYFFVLSFLIFFLMGFFQMYATISSFFSSARPLTSSLLLVVLSVKGFYAETISLFTLFFSIITSVLFSLQIIFSYYYFRKRGSLLVQKSSFFGMFFSLVGIGCASCGAVVFSTFFSFFGISGFLNFLPFGGEELSVLGLIFIVLSLLVTSYKINQPLVC